MRLAELIGTFSLATDAGTGVPEEHGLRSAALAVRLGELARADDGTRADAFYLTLLRYSGCTAGADVVVRVLGDEIEFAKERPVLDFGRPQEILPAVLGRALRSGGAFAGLSSMGGVLAALPGMPEVGRQHCETAVLLGRRMGFPQDFLAALYQGFERWDGSGQPTRARGEAISAPMRFAQLALDADRGYRLGGIEAAIALTKKHAGRELDPSLVDLFAAHTAELMPIFDAPSAWTTAMQAEPATQRVLDDAGIDEALLAMADFADLKSRFTRGHSRGVAERAELAAKHLRLGAAAEKTVYRAGLVHDVGRVAVSVLVWDKPGPLTDPEWERARFHAYAGERVLSRATGLRAVAEVATLTHERLDGSGYHRRLPQTACSLGARILAAADVYQALIEARPHRAARSPDEAAAEMRREAAKGTLASEAVEAVLGVSGHRERPAAAAAGLTEREVEVLALVAKGLTNKEIANRLDISVKTAGRHLEHIFEKLAVTTRAGATMTALQRGLLSV